MTNGSKRSDSAIAPLRAANNGASGAAEPAEGRAETGRIREATARTGLGSWARVSQAAERIRQAATGKGEKKLTALPHAITADVDGVTWHEYRNDPDARPGGLDDQVHGGAYRPLPPWRAERPKPDSTACRSCRRTLRTAWTVLAASRCRSHPHRWRGLAVTACAALLLMTGGNAGAQGTVATDRAALVALYNATDGANWTNNTYWSTIRPLSDWYGVTTNADGRVTRVSLQFNELSGTIPAGLGGLDILQDLYLSENTLTGAIPEELGNLANLQKLYLYANALSGTIPEELGNLANLRELYLHTNALTGAIPVELGNLGNLKFLYLELNELSGAIPAELGNLGSLLELHLSSNMLSGAIPEELGNLGSLQILLLADNTLNGDIPDELTNLNQLQVFDIYNTGLCVTPGSAVQMWLAAITFHGSVCGVEALTDREVLVALYNATDGANWTNNANWLSTAPLSDWYGVNTTAHGRVSLLSLAQNGLAGTIPVELGSLTVLADLYLQQNQLSGPIPAELGDLTSLLWLYLWDNELSGEIPAELGSLSRLQKLYLNQNQLSGPIPAELGNLTNLLQLIANQNQLSGPIPAELGDLTSLQYLHLQQNQLSGAIPAELGDLGNLLQLIANQNQLSGPIPAELGDLTSLQYLYLQQNQLSGAIPAELGDLGNLLWLYLWDNELSGEIPVELRTLSSLQRLYLNQNQLSGAIPDELANLTNLQQLSLSRNMLTGEIPAALESLANLRRLYLNENMLSGEIPAALGRLPSLAILSLYDNPQLYNYPANLETKANLSLLAPSTGEALCLPTTEGGADCTIPAQVDQLLLTPDPTRIAVRWEPKPASPTPTGYSVEYYYVDGWRADNVSVSGTTATITGLTPGSSYRVRVRPAAATTPWLQSSVTLPTLPTRPPPTGGGGLFRGGLLYPPEAPAALTATAGNGAVRLEWSPPESDGGTPILRYEYRLKEGRGEFGEWTPIADSAPDEANALAYTITGLVNGTVYVFELRGVNLVGNGRVSEAVEAVMPLDRAYWSNFLEEDLQGGEASLEWTPFGGSPQSLRLRFAAGLRFEESELDGEGEVRGTRSGGYGYRHTSRTTGELRLDYDGGESCKLRMTFRGVGAGSYSFRCGGAFRGQGTFRLTGLNRAPEITSAGPYEVAENRTRVGQLMAVDPDEGGTRLRDTG